MSSIARGSVNAATTALTTVVLVLAGAGAAYAQSPPWAGGENSVHAVFDWVSNTQAEWDTTVFETGPSNYPLHATQPYASDDGLNPTVILPNFIDPLPLKWIRIQMTFDGPVPGELIGLYVVGHDPEVTTASEAFRTTGMSTSHYIDYEIRPNPDWEELFFYGDASANIVPGNLLQIEIDTISTPEPAAFALFALGGLTLTRRRRR